MRQCNIEMCACVCARARVCSRPTPSSVRGGEGDGGRTEWEEEAVQYMRVFLRGDKSARPAKEKAGRARTKTRGRDKECERNGEQTQKRRGSERMEPIDQGNAIRRACAWAGEPAAAAAAAVVDGCDVLTPRSALGFIML